MKDLRSRTKAIHYATEDGSTGVCGFVTDPLAGYLARPGRDEAPVIYACGPNAMLASVSRLAAEHSIPCFVSMEERMACGLGVCMGCSVSMKAGGYKRVCKEGPVFDARDIMWSDSIPVRFVR
jgi:dihydroorotate dehydrogenase electron transfer subunit